VLVKSRVKVVFADPGGHAVCGVGLRPLIYRVRGYESRWGHGCSSLVFVVCCVGSGHCDGWMRVQRSPNRCVCLIVCDRESSQQWGGLGPSWVVAPQKREMTAFSNQSQVFHRANMFTQSAFWAVLGRCPVPISAVTPLIVTGITWYSCRCRALRVSTLS
jgi:hypothetical protein